MIRTQIQLTEAQARRLKQIAAAQGRSIADLIREGVDRLAGDDAASRRRERMKRAARSFGRFRSGRTDLANRHDTHFAAGARVNPDPTIASCATLAGIPMSPAHSDPDRRWLRRPDRG